MKLLNLAIVGLGVFALSSCGVADRHEEISELNRDTKWDEDKTNQAIDIMLEGKAEALDLIEDMYLIEEKNDLEGNIDRYGDRDVIKERKQEIKDAEKNLKEAMKAVEKEYKTKAPKNDDSYDYNYDDEAEYEEPADYEY